MTNPAEERPQPALTRIGAQQILAALRGVTSARVFDLGTELSHHMLQGPRDTFGGFRLTHYHLPESLVRPSAAPGFDCAVELVAGSPHLGTHIDALAHVQADGYVFGGLPVAEVFGDFGWTRNGMETVPPIVSRGVLLDVAHAHGYEQLPDSFAIGPGHLETCLHHQGVQLRQGDVVLVRTGKIADWKAGRDSYFAPAPGVSVEGALWLYDRGMAVLGTDTSGTEPLPFIDPAHTTHRALLVERGMHLIEILDLDAVAAERAYEFLFVCLPLKIVGGTGSWVRPIAIV
jgi:kynurenine formamidase